MINSDAILTAVGVSDEFAQRNAAVVAKPLTVLSELVRITNSGSMVYMAHGDTADENFLSFAESVDHVTSGSVEVPSSHDVYMDNVIEDISKAVKNHISFARNIVKPVVMDFAQNVKQSLESKPVATPSSQFCVVPLDLPELLSDESFISSLAFYNGKIPVTPESRPALGEKTVEEIYQLLMVGDQTTDQMIVGWHTRLGDQFFKDLWANRFQDEKLFSHQTNAWVSYEKLLGMNLFEKADHCLAMYLIASKLYESVDQSADKVSLAGYQTTMAAIRDFAGSTLMDVAAKVNAMNTTKTLVIDIRPDEQCCKVYGANYRKWLEQGGTPETLMGLIISRRRIYSQALIDEAKDDLIKQWNSFCTFYNAKESNLGFDRFKNVLELQYVELMKEFSEDEKPAIEKIQGYAEKCVQYFREELEKLTMADMRDIYLTSLKLVCRSRFFYTDAEKILTDINDAMLANPTMDVREAALIATVQYVADYVADQMILSTEI